jgi:hydroxymethylpyrimidine pyrophosphatase-like HAD family hydrolase
MTKIKAVIMDGDGSTITHDGILPDNLRDLIINNPQIKWIMATGRSLDLLRRLPIIDHLSRDVPHIVDGGGRLVLHSGESVIDHFLTSQEINSLFDQLELEKIDFLYSYLDEERSYIYSQNGLDHWSNRPQFATAKATNEIGEYRQWLLTNPPTKIFMRINTEISLTGINWHQNEFNIDVTAKDVTKGSSCYKLLEMLGLTPKETAFVFNDRNDLPLIEHPELQDIITIKVGDYLPETEANYHVATPHDVADVIYELINSSDMINK